MKKLSRFWRVAVSIVLTLGLYAIFESLPLLLPCTDHVAESLALALCAGMGCYLLTGGRSPWLLGGAVILVVLALWFGSTQPILKLRLRAGPLSGFEVTTQMRGNQLIHAGDILTLAAGQPAGLQARTSLQNVRCHWMSTRGGNFDDPESCATVYIPPKSENDIVKVSVQPGCGLPNTVGQIKISILP